MKVVHLHTLRKRVGLTQVQLARLSGVAQNTISKLESNSDASPVFATVVKLAEALHIHPAALPSASIPGQGPRAHRRAGGSSGNWRRYDAAALLHRARIAHDAAAVGKHLH